MNVAAAARRTLESDTARVRHRTYLHPKPKHDFTVPDEGVTDFQLRRPRLRVDNQPVELFFERLIERNPWLLDAGEEFEPDECTRVYAGTAAFTLSGEFCHAEGGQVWAPERAPRDP